MVEFEPLPDRESPPKPPPQTAGDGGRPPGVVRPARGFVRFLYCQNPFYVISAALVFWGLRLSFEAGGEAPQTDALMTGLVGYTLLLAAAAVFLIRAGGVWQDVRTILLLVVLMFLAISVSFDETLTAHPQTGLFHILGGLAFAIVLSEAVLWGIRLRMPGWFRVPYYLLLAVFFLYPAALGPLADRPGDPALGWTLLSFATAAAVAFLALVPAIRRGPGYVRDNGSPWPWPLYPWSLFVVLGFGVCGRAYFLCLSFYPAGGTDTIFGPYFLVPLLLAWCVLLLEMGIVSRSEEVKFLALLAPIGLLYVAATGPAAQCDDLGFLATFTKTLGASPLLLTVLALAVYYLVAMLRRVELASGALSAVLVVLVFCGPQTVDRDTLATPQGWPLLALAAVQGWLALRHRYSFCCLLAAGSLALGLALELPVGLIRGHLAVAAANLALAAVLAIGAAFRDDFAQFLRRAGAWLILAAGIASVLVDPHSLGNPPPALLAAYPAMLAAVAVVYGYLVGPRRDYYLAAACTAAGWLGIAGWRAYQAWRGMLRGLDLIALGILSFLVAMAISLMKTGLPQRWLARWRGHG